MRASKSKVLIVPSVIWIRREAHKPQIKKINAKPPPAPKAKNSFIMKYLVSYLPIRAQYPSSWHSSSQMTKFLGSNVSGLIYLNS